jgi:hypothetical protein
MRSAMSCTPTVVPAMTMLRAVNGCGRAGGACACRRRCSRHSRNAGGVARVGLSERNCNHEDRGENRRSYRSHVRLPEGE